MKMKTLQTKPMETIFFNFSFRVVKYISLYVVRSLGRKIKCECLMAITKHNENIPLYLTMNLVSIKNRGGLVQPSLDVHHICKISETIFKITALKHKLKSNISHYSNNFLSHCSNISFFIESPHLSTAE